MTGCSQGAKSSVDVTYWPEALRGGVELKTRCRVSRITLNSRGMADGVLGAQRCAALIEACWGLGQAADSGMLTGLARGSVFNPV